MADIHAALAQAQEWVGRVPNVVMVGLGDSTIDVWVTGPVDLPEAVQGVPIWVRRTDQIEAQ